MYRNSIITLVAILLMHERRVFALFINKSVCFIYEQNRNKNDTWCITELQLCGNTPAYDMPVNIKQFASNGDENCDKQCLNQSTVSLMDHTSEIYLKCNGKSNCSLADISVPSTSHGGILTLTFACNNTGDGMEEDNSTTKNTGNTNLPTSSSLTSTSIPTRNNNTRTTGNSTGNNTSTAGTARFSTGSSDSYTVAIVVSVVVPITVIVVVVAFLMYRRGQCKQLLGKCTKKYAKHSPAPDRTDTYAMSSEANANFTYDFSSDIDVSRSDVDYCEIDKVGQATGVEYNYVNLKQAQLAKDPTYNHIGNLNSSAGNTEQTYNHVGDETFQNTSLFTPDTYSHIGALAKPASEQLAEDSYAHIDGVKQYIPEVYDINQYDCAVFQPNGGPTGHQEREMKSDKEKTLK